jgi:hypothetical protein
MLAPPEMGSRELVNNADLVATISGSIGLEGLIMQVPVVVLGRAPFNFLPQSMIRHVPDPDSLGFQIRDLLESYQYNEKAIKSYIGGVMKESVPVDFYSRLLRRKEAFNPDLSENKEEEDRKRTEQFRLLSDYIVDRRNVLYPNIDSIAQEKI